MKRNGDKPGSWQFHILQLNKLTSGDSDIDYGLRVMIIANYETASRPFKITMSDSFSLCAFILYTTIFCMNVTTHLHVNL